MTTRRRRRSLIAAALPWALAIGIFAVARVAFERQPAAERTLAAPRDLAQKRSGRPSVTSPSAAPAPTLDRSGVDAAPAPRADADAPPLTAIDDADIAELRRRRLPIPVEGVTAVMLVSTFHQSRGHGEHEAIDILAPIGTPALAVEDGTVAKLFTSDRGGLTIYLFDPASAYCYYYAHLDHYADVHEGETVRRGDVIGYVGTTGNAPKNTPHLHFAVFKLGPEKHWWQGTPLDPYLIWR
jgi:murein DD-endopeptidase MepM/ murein hydrolase activator NlpD